MAEAVGMVHLRQWDTHSQLIIHSQLPLVSEGGEEYDPLPKYLSYYQKNLFFHLVWGGGEIYKKMKEFPRCIARGKKGISLPFLSRGKKGNVRTTIRGG